VDDIKGQFASYNSAQSPSGSERRKKTTKGFSPERRLFLVGPPGAGQPAATIDEPRRIEEGVLILAPAGVDGILIARALGDASIPVELCTNVEQLCGLLEQIVGTLVIAEEALTPTAIQKVTEVLEEQPPWSDLPIIVLTGGGAADRHTEAAAQNREILGNVSLLERPIRPITLVSAVRSALRARSRQYEIRDHLVQLTDVTAALAKSEQRYRSLVRAAASLVWIADAEGHASSRESDWRTFTGQSPEEYLQSGWISAVHSDDMDGVQKVWGNAIESRHVFDCEFRLKRTDGAFRLVHLRGVPVMAPDGTLQEWVGTCTDIQDQRAMEHALRNAEKFAIAGKLAGTIAHDINNPLESVTNLVYLVATMAKDEEVRGYAQSAQKELARISELTRQTLNFYRYSTKAEPVEVRELVQGVLRLLSKRIEDKQIVVDVKFSKAKPVRCYVSEMRQVIANIATNAIDAMSEGGRLQVRAGLRTDWKVGHGFGVRVLIADTGCGMSAEVRQRIFEPFFSTKQEKGNGLGLWISSEMLRKNNGRIAVKSRTLTGKSGTVFSIFLPCE
jgi:PAS domain S-box-containing protein